MDTSRTIVNPLSGDKIIFLETAAETGGAYTRVLNELAPGSTGPPLHFHHSYDETFTVAEGVLGFQLGKQILHLSKGDRCTAQAGQLHRFFNPSPTEKVIFEGYTAPANPGFEIMLQVAFGLASDGLTNPKGVPQKIEHLALLMQWGDTRLPGFYQALWPILHRIGQRAVRRGVDKLLIARYCRITPVTQSEHEERRVYAS